MFQNFPTWRNFTSANQNQVIFFNHLFTVWFQNIRVFMIRWFLTISWGGAVAKGVGFGSMVSRASNYPEPPWFFDCVGAYSTGCCSNRRWLLMADLMGVFAALFDAVISNLKNIVRKNDNTWKCQKVTWQKRNWHKMDKKKV